jgi:hypothetical protein
MKKWFWALPLMGLVFSSCAKSQTWEEVVRSLNETSDFDLSFLAAVSPKDLSGYGLWPGFGGEICCAKKYAVKEGGTPQGMLEAGSSLLYYGISAYPDFRDGGSFVTAIVCSDPAVRFAGHALGSSDAMKEGLVDLGFAYDSGSGSSASDPQMLSAGRLNVALVSNRSFILSFSVSNPDRIVY